MGKNVKSLPEIEFEGEFEAKLLALACLKVSESWMIRLLAEKLIALNIVSCVFPMTICNTLKKMN